MEDVALMQPFYMDMTDGLAFKRVFGQKPVMLGFLNEVFKGKYTFEDLYFSDPLLLLSPWEDPKNILMARCIDSEERHHYIEILNADTSYLECKDDLERLFCVSRLMVESQEEIVDDSLPEWIVRLIKKATYASLMPDEIFRYMTSEDDHHYRQVELEDARCDRRDEYMEEGKRQSVKCGVEKGKDAAAEDIVKKMVANEIDMNLISYCTGLSPATIKML